MGKSPGKWIKTLLGKKSSKSNLSKGQEKLNSATKEESLVSSKVAVSNLSVDPPSVSPPIPRTGARNLDLEKGVAVELPKDGVDHLSLKLNEDDHRNINFGSQEDPERIMHEQAAKKAQAAFRGYRARKAFRTLKGIIRLQALIRGHLVRRQAVATLCCVWGIVKFQALARGRKVRCLDIGIEVQKKHLATVLGDKSSQSFGVSTYTRMEKLSKYAVVRKLLASSPTPLPLWLQYGLGEPNSAWEWLERWTILRFWELPSQTVKNLSSKSQTKNGSFMTVETEQGRPKRNVRKLSSASVAKSSSRSTSEYEKPKRNMRNVSGHPVDSVWDHPKSEINKVKQNLRKLTDSTKEASDRLEVNDEKPKLTLMKASKSAVPVVLDKGTSESAEKGKDMTVTVSKQSDLDTDMKLTVADIPVEELHDHLAIDSQPVENNGKTESIQETNMELYSKDDNISNENLKASERRASLPAKVDHQDNVLHSTRKVPSYMAPTESAKAKLRGQGSPRFSQDVVEKNGITRRYSLPSSANDKLNSLSPRAQGLVQASGKGVISSDRSLSSSRDASDKTIRAEWRR